jgi:hypothetical protein
MPSDVSRHTPSEKLVSRIKVIDHAMQELWRSVQAQQDERKRKFKSRYDQDVFLKPFELDTGDALKGLSAQDITAILTR